MHTAPMKDSEGDFGEPEHSDDKCRKCGTDRVFFRRWDSHCGGYTDLLYECRACGHMWWIEGPDA